MNKKGKRKVNVYEPLETVIASTSTTATRRNAAATIKRTDEFVNIENGIVPFKSSSNTDYNSCMDIRDAVILCQKAYYNFSIFRNTIDLMTEFSSSHIFFKDGSKKSRDFFQNLFTKINIFGLQDRFFREYYRSGNVFIYRLNGTILQEDLLKINQIYGLKQSLAKSVTIPVKYIILNPADIKVGGNISFASAMYYKSLTDYELQRLRSPRTDEDKEVIRKLPSEVKSKIAKSKGYSEVLMPLPAEEILAVFYKKQDYEPFAVPMGYPVLADINWKAEMKKMDMALTRTMNQVILLITLGNEPEKGGVNQKHLQAMQDFFKNESIARVLIADYTTKAQWVIPDIANLLDPKKYAVVDKDIKEGLNNLLINSEDKFANASVKIEVFVERLRQAREAFINEFLLPEIKRIAKEVGFKNYPTPYFEDIDLKDNLEYAKLYTRLGELGILTPSEVLESIDNGRLPSTEESLENQESFRKYKDKGYFEPIVGGPFSQKKLQEDSYKNQSKMEEQKIASEEKKHSKELKHRENNPDIYKPPQPINVSSPSGRPSGSSTSKKPGKIGASYSISKLKDILINSTSLENKIENYICEKYKIKNLNKEQKSAAETLLTTIVANESPDKWFDSIDKYVKDPSIENKDNLNVIDEISAEHNISQFLASLLYHSQA